MRWVQDEKFKYYGVSLKNSIFKGTGEDHEKPRYRGGLLGGGGMDIFQI